MRIGDVLALPVNPAAEEPARVYADAKVTEIHGESFAFEFIAGEDDGFAFQLNRRQLDELLGREGGEEWKA